MSCRILFAGMALALAGCAVAIPVLPASSSKSQFEGAVYSGIALEVDKPTPGVDLYRVFQQGATGFVPIGAVRGSVEEVANIFCARKGKQVHLVQEITSPTLILPGNFPRVEWLFECLDAPKAVPNTSSESERIDQLERLRRLLDNGTLTQKEFDTQKARVLGQGPDGSR